MSPGLRRLLIGESIRSEMAASTLVVELEGL
ncbi:hypothetical protein DFO66_102326 [Brevibacterium sanguinis]|uniref:Uncharacterized protein n=2 Tax=Brevibacterium TaxID=1696 RepID=A0A366INP5_9MICO|nr:hypothetical protein DFO66_102326 [Brevibacterium sanguinis]RBP73795.1 hypothetical protein DFO65_102326 [Brevibacterium celere]